MLRGTTVVLGRTMCRYLPGIIFCFRVYIPLSWILRRLHYSATLMAEKQVKKKRRKSNNNKRRSRTLATLTFFFQQQNLNWVLIEADYDHYNQIRITSHIILYLLIHEFYITESFLVVIDMNIFQKKNFY